MGVRVQVQGEIHTPCIGIATGLLEAAPTRMSTHASFSGSVPVNYDRYLGPALFEPYANDLAARLPARAGLRVLELACGTGRVTRRLRAALPATATLVATDLNEAMIEFARATVPGPGISWQQANAQELPFADAAFDAVVCQFGLMFLPDKVKGLGEARRVLAPGGLFVASVWESVAANPHARAIQAVLDDLYPDSPPRFLDVPYGYCDEERIRADYAAAAWESPVIEHVHLHSQVESSGVVASGFATGSPLSHELAERGADLEQVADLLTAALGSDSPHTVELAALVISATT
jgi:ubiquinone/menaquinone biosynthesis C-methylase UbiE